MTKTTTSKEFVVDVPNGTYDVTYTVAGINYYNAITAEGQSIEKNQFRTGSRMSIKYSNSCGYGGRRTTEPCGYNQQKRLF